MSGRTILVAALALACGLAAFVGISMMGQGQPAATVATKPVVFAIAEVRRGEPIQKEMIEVRQVPESQLPPAALGNPEDVLDRVAGMKMLPGDAVTDAKLEAKGARSRLVPAGKLAFTVAKADMPPLEVDDHVDVYFTGHGPPGPASATFDPLQDILVWEAPDASAKAGAPKALGPVTLLVDPQQASLLNQGMNQGELRLVRRNPKDPARVAIVPPKPTPAATPAAPDLSADIPPGMRAFTIEAPNPLATLGGRLRRGDRVDVLVTRKPTDGRAGAMTMTLPNVEVLGMPAADGPSSKDGRSITLLVVPDDAETLARAQAEGTILLSLRKSGDVAVPPPLDPILADQDVTMTTRTLRGTFLGSDGLTVRVPAEKVRAGRDLASSDAPPPGPSTRSARKKPARGR